MSELGYPSVTGATATSLASALKSLQNSVEARTEHVSLVFALEDLPKTAYHSLLVIVLPTITATAPIE